MHRSPMNYSLLMLLILLTFDELGYPLVEVQPISTVMPVGIDQPEVILLDQVDRITDLVEQIVTFCFPLKTTPANQFIVQKQVL